VKEPDRRRPSGGGGRHPDHACGGFGLVASCPVVTRALRSRSAVSAFASCQLTLARKILGLFEGTIGEISALLTCAALVAVERGTEQITSCVLDDRSV
jgi:hypothetical protein